VAWVREQTIPIGLPPLVGEVSAPTFVDSGCNVVSVTDPYGRILGFLDLSRYVLFQVALHLYSRGSVEPDCYLYYGENANDLKYLSYITET
jgi:hypothetical protein